MPVYIKTWCQQDLRSSFKHFLCACHIQWITNVIKALLFHQPVKCGPVTHYLTALGLMNHQKWVWKWCKTGNVCIKCVSPANRANAGTLQSRGAVCLSKAALCASLYLVYRSDMKLGWTHLPVFGMQVHQNSCWRKKTEHRLKWLKKKNSHSMILTAAFASGLTWWFINLWQI